jgi:hypothetical protein
MDKKGQPTLAVLLPNDSFEQEHPDVEKERQENASKR